MPSLQVADDDQIDGIYRESHRLWGAGLGYDDYRGLWDDLRATPWGRRHATFYAWTGDDGTVLSSLKLYRPRLSLLGSESRAAVLGAIFTPVALRCRGHAAELVREVLALARGDGHEIALLFSDIGTTYYTGFGFRGIPAMEQWGMLPARPPATGRGWKLRPMEPADHDDVLEAHLAFCRRRSLALLRDADHWEFLRVRSRRFFDRLDDSGLRLVSQVAERNGRFAGYVIAVEGRGEWNVREVGAVDGDPALMARVLESAATEARRSGMRSFYAWLPPEVLERLSHWRIRARRRRRALPMLLALDGSDRVDAIGTPEAAYLPFQDQF